MFSSFAPFYKNKTIVITGAGNGIGAAALAAFEQAGARVIAHTGRTPIEKTELAQLKTVGAEHRAVFNGDFTTNNDQDAFIDFVKSNTEQIDVLINNAGTMFGRFPADELHDDQYENIVALNQTSVVRITRSLIPLLAQSHAGAIINTVSISASTGGSPGSSIYSASKAFVTTYTKALARELAPKNIRANAVSPGVIDTEFHKRYSSLEKLEKTRQAIPLQRLGTAQDCAPAFLYLGANELSGYITGQVLEINGGM